MKKLVIYSVISLICIGSTAQTVSQQAAERVAGLDVSQMNAICESGKQATAELVKKGTIRLTRENSFDCGKAVEKYYTDVCSTPGVECERYATFGLIVWLVGAEINIPWIRVPYLKSSRFDLRGVLGISFVQTQQEGTNKMQWRRSIVFQPAFSTIFDRRSPSPQGQNMSVPEGDLFQWVLGGITVMLVPSGKEAELPVDGIFASSLNPSTAQFWSQFYKSQIGVVYEGKTPGQSDLNQTTSYIAALTTNVPGLVNMSGLTSDARGHAAMISIYHLIGKIRTENGGFQLSPIIEVANF